MLITNIEIDEIVNSQSTPMRVVVVSNDNEKYYALNITYTEFENLEVVNQTYPNARMLSADLVAELGLGPAVDLLVHQSVPRYHPLWDLNHSGLWER